jgi:internalin A
VGYKDELKRHLNLLHLFNIADNWSCDEISIEKWHDKIQKELQESDLIVYMLSVNFFSSDYIINHEVNEGIKIVSADQKKKIVCVIVSNFLGLNNLEKFLKGKLISDTQEAIKRLSEWQYLPYGKIKNEITGNWEEKIIPLKDYPGSIENAYTQIAEKIWEALE